MRIYRFCDAQQNNSAIEITKESDLLPVTVDEVIYHCNLDIPSQQEQKYITKLIQTVSTMFEEYTYTTIFNKEYCIYLDYPEINIVLRKSPFSSFKNIQYLNKENKWITIDEKLYYITKDKPYSFLVFHHESDVKNILNKLNDMKESVKVSFIAGFGDDPEKLPSTMKVGILNHIAYLYANRGDYDMTEIPPKNMQMIYDRYKIISYGAPYYR